jgi:hypothetical protein
MFRHRQHCPSGASVGDSIDRDQALVSFEIGRVAGGQMPNAVRKHRGDDIAVMHLLAVNVELPDQAQALVEYISPSRRGPGIQSTRLRGPRAIPSA